MAYRARRIIQKTEGRATESARSISQDENLKAPLNRIKDRLTDHTCLRLEIRVSH